MKKKKQNNNNLLIHIVLSVIFLAILVTAGTISITLNSPSNNNYMVKNNIVFNATGSTNSGYIVNASLWHNATATFHRNETYYSGDYLNSTLGFDVNIAGAGSPVGVATNGTDFWVVDNVDKWVYHFKNQVNQTDGFSTTASFSFAPLGISLINNTAFWIGFSVAGQCALNQISVKGINLSVMIDLDSGGFGNTQAWDSNQTDVWVSDNTNLWVNHYLNIGGTLTNQTDGFSLADLGNPTGVAKLSDGDYFIMSIDIFFISHFNSSGDNQTDGFDVTGFGSGSPRWLSDYEQDLIYIDTADKFVYYLKPKIKGGEIIFTKNLSNSGIWGAEYCDSEGTCGFSSNNTYYIVIEENSNTYNSTTYQTESQTYTFNITADQTPTAKLYLNNINQGAGTITAYAGNNYVITKAVDINNSWNGSIEYYWEITLSSTIINNTIETISVNPVYFNYCNSTLTNKYLNLTFKDESTLAFIYNSIPTSTFFYWLGSGTQRKSITYANTTAGIEFNFCSNAVNNSVYINPYIQYKNTTDYPQRTYNSSSLTLYNYTTNLTLYSLATADGIYVTFQVTNPSNQVLNNVFVNATTIIDGSYTIVGQGFTGADGTVTFWLNPDASHNFVFARTGFAQYEASFFPTQSIYTVILGGSVAEQIKDYTHGVSISILPGATADLVNDTTYNFNITISTSYWDLDEWGIVLKLSNGTILDADNDTTLTGGTIGINLHTGNYSKIIMDYYWVINSTTSTRSTYWNIRNTDYGDWSIKNLFDDVKAYLDTEPFGLDDFGKNLIIYLILFISVGIMSYKYGLTSPMVISAMVFVIIYFFDVTVDLLTSPIEMIPNVYTFLAGIIFLAVAIREVITR